MKTLIVFTCTLFISASLWAQEWSAEQKDVWKNVETYWDLGAKGDIEGFLSYFHDDFSGWPNASPFPHDKDARVKFVKFSFSNTETVFYNITPLAIKIHGNVAFVHYYYLNVTKHGEKKESTEQGRWTDILMKQGEKWVMIGDHGGPDPLDD
jgi:ketosteroid isomerase-like protein